MVRKQMEEELMLFFGCRDPEGEENCRTSLFTISHDFFQFFCLADGEKGVIP
jgi:hypothetical protein